MLKSNLVTSTHLLIQLFSQLDHEDGSKRYSGYGVGLFICKRILELLGGSVSAESDGKTGSTFNVVFPVQVLENSFHYYRMIQSFCSRNLQVHH